LVSNAVITKDSKVCFDVARLAPWLIWEIEFYIPKHKIEKNLSFDWVNKVWPFVLDFGNNDLGNGEGDLSCLDKTSDVICKIPENLSPEFKSPFSVSLKVIDNITGDLNGQPIMWQKQEYVLTLINNGLKLDITNWNLDINRNSVKPISNWHIWLTQAEWFKIVSNESFISTNGYLNPQEFKFQAQVDVWTPDLEEILKWIEVSTKDLLISYTINWQFVSYPLDDVSIKWCEDISTLWVKVVWTVQWSWINQSAGLESNFSDLSKSEARAKIRQNAYTLVKNMKSWDVLNGVKYVEWNIRISWDLDYETLIIKDWNVIIDWDLNTSNNKLWIIVLRDGYNVLTDWNKFWNVYVSNTVEEINAIIYADWALRSADKNWNSYWDNQLWDRLTIFGSLFTRNTIWWVIWWWASMTLPWWQKTNNYELASVYDLNYIRKTPICSADDYSLLIKYNPSITTNPPKWFTN
jgi:hypothetical protein